MTFSDLEFEIFLNNVLQGNSHTYGIWWKEAHSFSAEQLQRTLERVNSLLDDNPNHSEALTLRALMHHTGRGGPINYYEAIALYERAIALGNSTAMNNRAFMYHCGQGTFKNYAKAIYLYDQAIALGNEVAMYNRACMYCTGLGSNSADLDAGSDLYYRSSPLCNDSVVALKNLSKNKCIVARYCLSLIYILMEDKKNWPTAIKWLQKHTHLFYIHLLRYADQRILKDQELEKVLDFFVKNDRAQFSREKRLLELKWYFKNDRSEEAFRYYAQHFISTEGLTAKELFLLGSAQLAHSDVGEKDLHMACLNQAAILFQQSYKKGELESKHLFIYCLRELDAIEKGLPNHFGPINDELSQKDRNLIETFEAKLTLQIRKEKLIEQKAMVKGFIAVNSISRFPTFFHRPSRTHSTQLAHMLLEQLEAGITLEEMLKENDEIRSQIKQSRPLKLAINTLSNAVEILKNDGVELKFATPKSSNVTNLGQG